MPLELFLATSPAGDEVWIIADGRDQVLDIINHNYELAEEDYREFRFMHRKEDVPDDLTMGLQRVLDLGVPGIVAFLRPHDWRLVLPFKPG